MELELENVLKYDFYMDKLDNYHVISLETLNYLLQLKSINVISEEEYKKDLDFLTIFYTNLLEFINNIGYKYNNLMDEIFDISFDGDLRAVSGSYITKEKIYDFNKNMAMLEETAENFFDGIIQLLDDLSLKKMFVVDMVYLSQIERSFDLTYQKIEYIEENFGSFDDSIY